MNLLSLPQEILVEILCNVTLFDFECLTVTHPRFLRCLASSLRLQHHHFAQKAGLRDNPDSTVPLNERRNLLVRHEMAWSQGQVVASRNIPVDSPNEITDFSVSGDIMFFPDPSNHRILWFRLPNPSEEVHSSFINLDPEVVMIGNIVRNGDLLVLYVKLQSSASGESKTEIHLLHFPTGNPHPLATRPIILVSNVPSQNQFNLNHMELLEEKVVFISSEKLHTGRSNFMNVDQDYVCVLNWMTGQFLKSSIDIASDESTTLISSSLLLATNNSNRTLMIWLLPCSESTDLSRCKFLLELSLPRLPNLRRRFEISPNSHLNSGSHLSSSVPFNQDPANSLILLDFIPDQASKFHLVIHRSNLVKLCRIALGSQRTSLIWDEWGPPITGWVGIHREIDLERQVSGCAGQRFISFYEDALADNQGLMIVADFNPRRPIEFKVSENEYALQSMGGSLPFLQRMLAFPAHFTGDIPSDMAIDGQKVICVVREDVDATDPKIVEIMIMYLDHQDRS